ncbi:MAG TPA: tetratricopeptide repeat protein [Xanthobacteraceae bacterium]
MTLRTSVILCALTVALYGGVAAAQSAPRHSPLDKPSRKDLVEPPANPPKPQRGDRTHNLDFLFGALKAAPDDVSAKHIEDRIWALWLVSGSDTCNLLMTRVKAAIDGENYDLAIHLLDAIIEVRPNYVEAWNRRASVFFLEHDYGSAIADLRQVLKREPRHFGALAGLGSILQDIGDDKDALEVYRRALAVHPHLNGVAEKVKLLTDKVEGRAI